MTISNSHLQESPSSYHVIVLNGSPKGSQSITLQYVYYFQHLYPKHNFTTFNIAQQIKSLEKNPKKLNQIYKQIESADLILWAFPLYYMLVHSGLKRFIELIFERHREDIFHDKFTATLSTSIKFYDHTAHNYLQAVCEDLNMNFLGYGAFHMQDLLTKTSRSKVTSFFHTIVQSMDQHAHQPSRFSSYNSQATIPSLPSLNLESLPLIELNDKRISIIVDNSSQNHNLAQLVSYFQHMFRSSTSQLDIVKLDTIDIKSGCLGCLQCGVNYKCVFQEKDGYYSFAEQYLKGSDLIFIASPIIDHYLTSRWQMVFERFFYNNHTPSLQGKYIGYILTGPVQANQNMQEILFAFAEMHNATNLGIFSDEALFSSTEIEVSEENIQRQLYAFAKHIQIQVSAEHRMHTFRQVGGRLVFRDEIYGGLNMVFQADHQAYRKMGIYKTFPGRKHFFRKISAGIMRLLQKLPGFRKHMRGQLPRYMIAPYQKFLQKLSDSKN